MKWRLAASAAMLTSCCLTASGCATGGGITPGSIQSSMSVAFSHLYQLQLRELGDPVPTISALHTHTSCQKGIPADVQAGPGSDWTCDVFFDVSGIGDSIMAIYNLDVKADGCFAADGDGPVDLNGTRTITTAAGAQTPNPLWLIDSCFPLA